MKVIDCANVLSSGEVEQLLGAAVRLLARVGVRIENRVLLERLADAGAEVDFDGERCRFPASFIDEFLAAAAPEYDADNGLECSCLLPGGNRRAYANGLEITAGAYPQHLLTLDGEIRPHTRQSVADMTRLADALDHYDRLGVMGIPSDVPPVLGPLYMRYTAWRHAEKKLSNCGEVRDLALLPYIFEMGEIMAASRHESARKYTFAEVELISPLQFTRIEAETFVQFWDRGLLCGVGFMHSAGGSAPVTLAGAVALDLAESLFVNILYRLCYGWRKLWLQCNSSVLDMRTGMYPFGRPEKGLMILAMGQLARHLDAGIWASAHYADAKTPGIEAGMQSAFNAVPAILAGATGLECFGLLSTGELGSPIQLVIDNEYASALKRFARGFEVNAETIAEDLIAELGPGGIFMGTDHTVRHYRDEHWEPRIFSRQPLNAWLAGPQQNAAARAREIVAETLRSHHPRGMDEDTEKALLAVIAGAEESLV